MIVIKGWVDHKNLVIMSRGSERIAVQTALQFLNSVRACGLSECDIHSADGQWKFHFNVHSNGRIILKQIA